MRGLIHRMYSALLAKPQRGYIRIQRYKQPCYNEVAVYNIQWYHLAYMPKTTKSMWTAWLYRDGPSHKIVSFK